MSGAGLREGRDAAAASGLGEESGTRWVQVHKSAWKTPLGSRGLDPPPVGSAAAGIFCLF